MHRKGSRSHAVRLSAETIQEVEALIRGRPDWTLGFAIDKCLRLGIDAWRREHGTDPGKPPKSH